MLAQEIIAPSQAIPKRKTEDLQSLSYLDMFAEFEIPLREKRAALPLFDEDQEC